MEYNGTLMRFFFHPLQIQCHPFHDNDRLHLFRATFTPPFEICFVDLSLFLSLSQFVVPFLQGKKSSNFFQSCLFSRVKTEFGT